MGIGPIPAVAKVMERTGLTLAEMDLIELNEAFASQVLACTRDWGIDAATDERLERQVAVKVIPGPGAQGERGRREALAAGRLDHPGVVAVFDAGEDSRARYLVSELVRGRTLAELLRAGAIADRDVARIGVALCEALDHAHARGVIHRDVKPQNVIVPDAPRSAAGVAKLADFGVAHLAGDEPLTRTGDVVGTLAYMAPEQASGKRIDERADLYSLALVLYEALAESPPAAVEQRLAQVEGDPSKAELTAALRDQLAVGRRMEAQLQRFYDELERILVELDTVRGNLVSVSASTEAANQQRLAGDVRALREEVGAVAAGMSEAYEGPSSA